MNNFNQFEQLANMPGITFKRFCSFCTEEATGDLQVPVPNDAEGTEDQEFFPLPVCEVCAKKILDKAPGNMID